MNNKKWIVIALVVLWAGAFATESIACPVCYGESDSPMVKGAELSILFMAVLTYCMIIGGVFVFFFLRRRARRLEKQTGAAVVGSLA